MTKRIYNYLSCFGPQFVDGILVLARSTNFERQRFRKKIKPMPNFFELARIKKNLASSPKAQQLRLAIGSAIAIAWILTITALAFLNLNWWGALILIAVVSVPAPYILIGVAAWCLPKSHKAR
jgi:hypothetical protein